MAQYHKHVLCFVLSTLAAAYGSMAMDYVVSNNAGNSIGAARFDKEIGAEYAKQTLSSAAEFIESLFQQNNNNNNADSKSVQKVSMIVENIDGVAFASNNNIHVSAGYIERYPGDIKKEITGVLYHEMAHLLQNDGMGEAPSGLIEGIADFVRMKAGYAAENWNPPCVGYDWCQGNEVTAHFLNYCDGIRNGFVADLNKKMKTGYSESYFSELLGKPVSQLWSDYKAMNMTN
ncbi:uncharacterized protein LOC133316183 [Gastrolobium bilobum]|uniref:uncharacterized protein LOC133316183 n=1 Tax=Gastrolobium bilobum TaxID=150636 RepID=UPI002AAF59E6|nr:uncharacterized protein LOC133316183 [Gastrolobium bilobum]